MLYECRNCGHGKAFGCLPTVSCGAFLGVTIGISLSAIFWAVDTLIRFQGVTRGTIWLLGILAGIALPGYFLEWRRAKEARLALELLLLDALLVLAIVPYFLLQLIEFILVLLTRCAHCGSHRWSWGKTSGFGL